MTGFKIKISFYLRKHIYEINSQLEDARVALASSAIQFYRGKGLQYSIPLTCEVSDRSHLIYRGHRQHSKVGEDVGGDFLLQKPSGNLILALIPYFENSSHVILIPTAVDSVLDRSGINYWDFAIKTSNLFFLTINCLLGKISYNNKKEKK